MNKIPSASAFNAVLLQRSGCYFQSRSVLPPVFHAEAVSTKRNNSGKLFKHKITGQRYLFIFVPVIVDPLVLYCAKKNLTLVFLRGLQNLIFVRLANPFVRTSTEF